VAAIVTVVNLVSVTAFVVATIASANAHSPIHTSRPTTFISVNANTA